MDLKKRNLKLDVIHPSLILLRLHFLSREQGISMDGGHVSEKALFFSNFVIFTWICTRY